MMKQNDFNKRIGAMIMVIIVAGALFGYITLFGENAPIGMAAEITETDLVDEQPPLPTICHSTPNYYDCTRGDDPFDVFITPINNLNERITVRYNRVDKLYKTNEQAVFFDLYPDWNKPYSSSTEQPGPQVPPPTSATSPAAQPIIQQPSGTPLLSREGVNTYCANNPELECITKGETIVITPNGGGASTVIDLKTRELSGPLSSNILGVPDSPAATGSPAPIEITAGSYSFIENNAEVRVTCFDAIKCIRTDTNQWVDASDVSGLHGFKKLTTIDVTQEADKSSQSPTTLTSQERNAQSFCPKCTNVKAQGEGPNNFITAIYEGSSILFDNTGNPQSAILADGSSVNLQNLNLVQGSFGIGKNSDGNNVITGQIPGFDPCPVTDCPDVKLTPTEGGFSVSTDSWGHSTQSWFMPEGENYMRVRSVDDEGNPISTNKFVILTPYGAREVEGTIVETEGDISKDVIRTSSGVDYLLGSGPNDPVAGAALLPNSDGTATAYDINGNPVASYNSGGVRIATAAYCESGTSIESNNCKICAPASSNIGSCDFKCTGINCQNLKSDLTEFWRYFGATVQQAQSAAQVSKDLKTLGFEPHWYGKSAEDVNKFFTEHVFRYVSRDGWTEEICAAKKNDVLRHGALLTGDPTSPSFGVWVAAEVYKTRAIAENIEGEVIQEESDENTLHTYRITSQVTPSSLLTVEHDDDGNDERADKQSLLQWRYTLDGVTIDLNGDRTITDNDYFRQLSNRSATDLTGQRALVRQYPEKYSEICIELEKVRGGWNEEFEKLNKGHHKACSKIRFIEEVLTGTTPKGEEGRSNPDSGENIPTIYNPPVLQ